MPDNRKPPTPAELAVANQLEDRGYAQVERAEAMLRRRLSAAARECYYEQLRDGQAMIATARDTFDLAMKYVLPQQTGPASLSVQMAA